MASTHSIRVLSANSRYAGRNCPVTRTELRPGDRFVVCHKNDEAFSWAALPDLEGCCPYCNQQIDLGQILTRSGKPAGKLEKPSKTEESQLEQRPGHSPPRRRSSLPLPLISVITLLSLGLVSICGVGVVVGYRGFFVQSTAVPTASPSAAQATEAPEVVDPTVVSSPATAAGDPANIPVSATPIRQVTVVPTVSESFSEEEVVNVIRRFNADQTTAVRDWNLEMLRSTCTGRCFVAQRDYMEQLTQGNLYEIQEQLGFEVLSVHVPGNTAEVVTSETWRTAKYDRSTHECRYHQPTFVSQQTYTLVREGGTWKITWDNFDTPAPADIPGC